MAYIYFAITVILQTASQLLQKYGLNNISTPVSIHDIPAAVVAIIKNPYLVAGVLCSGFGLIFWIAALSKFKLSYLYPMGAVIYILIALLGHWILKETVTPTNWIGIIIICAGVFLLNYGR